MHDTFIITDLPLFLALYIAFAMKQFLGDFLLQPNWVARGKGAPTGWARPLAMHAAMHASLTTLIAVAVSPALWWIGLLDFMVHFAIDRSKVLLTRRFALGPGDEAFWWAFGVDQMAHQMTHIAWILILITA